MQSRDEQMIDLWVAYLHVTLALRSVTKRGEMEEVLDLLAQRESLKETIEHRSPLQSVNQATARCLLPLITQIASLEEEIGTIMSHLYLDEKSAQARLKGYGVLNDPRRGFVDLAT